MGIAPRNLIPDTYLHGVTFQENNINIYRRGPKENNSSAVHVILKDIQANCHIASPSHSVHVSL